MKPLVTLILSLCILLTAGHNHAFGSFHKVKVYGAHVHRDAGRVVSPATDHGQSQVSTNPPISEEEFFIFEEDEFQKHQLKISRLPANGISSFSYPFLTTETCRDVLNQLFGRRDQTTRFSSKYITQRVLRI